METSICLQLGDANGKRDIDCPEILADAYNMPLEQIYTPPYDNDDEQAKSNSPIVMSTVLAEAHVALQNGLNCQSSPTEDKMRNVRQSIRYWKEDADST
jgi:hypothetical protein